MPPSRIAVVTGASRGAGKTIAVELGRAGWTVVPRSRSTRHPSGQEGISGTIDETADLVEDAGGTAPPIRCDHTSEEDVVAPAQKIKVEFAQIPLLVN
jgi:NAD(P)-dependent dehydrogenase (short-subunit alcohol dehydrogenase family)